MTRTLALAAALVLSTLAGRAAAQEAGVPRDSLRSYDLAEIVVQTGAEPERAPPTTTQRLPLAAVARQDAAGVSEVMRLVPAAYVQTNSRGESLVYLRGAGERQVALFYDGALLNVPWDNRLDLSLVPAALVGGVTVVKGVPSVLYGTNVLGGAVNLTSRTLAAPGRFTEVSVRGGAPRSVQAGATHLHSTGRFSYAAAAGYVDRSGDALPADADLAFSQDGGALRTNTDRRLLNLYAAARYRFGADARAGLSLLHIDGAKGVAPESHLDPATSNVRYWRYPDWRATMLVASGTAAPAPGTRLQGAAWAGRFAQTIAQYGSDEYATMRGREEGEDRVLGTRLTLAQSAGPGELRLALNALTAAHDQREMTYDEHGARIPYAASPAGEYPTYTFRQHTLSAGAEYASSSASRLSLLAGASVDAMLMPETGDKPARDPFVDYGVTTGATYTLSPTVSLRAAAGRKVRFPTMRELFGEALNRFAVNPGLRPESSFLAETAARLSLPDATGEVVVFLNRTFDTIDQQTLPDRRRQRINLDGSRVFGVEAGGTVRPAPRLSLEGHLTWMHVRAFDDDDARPLTEKPSWLGTLTAVYNTRRGLSLLLQPVYTGPAFSMAEDGTFARLHPSLVVNARLAYRLFRSAAPSFFSEWFVRVDNAFDAATLPQLGLPGPGREFHAGLSVAL